MCICANIHVCCLETRLMYLNLSDFDFDLCNASKKENKKPSTIKYLHISLKLQDLMFCLSCFHILFFWNKIKIIAWNSTFMSGYVWLSLRFMMHSISMQKGCSLHIALSFYSTCFYARRILYRLLRPSDCSMWQLAHRKPVRLRHLGVCFILP